MDTPLLTRMYNLGLKAVPNFTVLSEAQVAYYERHLDELQAAIRRGFVLPETAQPEKFALLADLGMITVPGGYDHATALATFLSKNHKKFRDVDINVTDKNFPTPSRVLRPGDKFRVRVWKQIVSGETTSEERMGFCCRQPGNCFTGVQGLSLVFDLMGDRLPKGFWHASFDKADCLPGEHDHHRVPGMNADSDGGFFFELGYLEYVWDEDFTFLSFCDQALIA